MQRRRNRRCRTKLAGILLAVAVAAACEKPHADATFSLGAEVGSVRTGGGATQTFSEVTDAAFISTGELVVLDRVAARLTLVQDGVARKSLRLNDSNGAALLISTIRGDSIAVWDAFANSLVIVDGELTSIGRIVTDLPPLQTVVGVLSDGVPVLAATRPLGSSPADTYSPDSVPLATWDGRLHPLEASVPQWPTVRLQVGSSAAAVGPIWSRRGQAKVRGNTLWIGDGASPRIARISRQGTAAGLVVQARHQPVDRAAEVERRLASLPTAVHDSARSLFAQWATDLTPPFFGVFHVDALERVWVRLLAAAPSDSVTWVVYGRTSLELANVTLPAGWRFLDASTAYAAFAVVEPSGEDRIVLRSLARARE